MSEEMAAVIREFVGALKDSRRPHPLGAGLDLIKIGAIIWAAAQLAGEVRVLRGDVTEMKAHQATYAREFYHHLQDARAYEERIKVLERR